MAVTVKNRRGKKVVLLNPQEKRNKYFDELANDVALTNNKHLKTKRNGKPKRLTDAQKAYRSGYIQAQNDSAKCYKAKKAKRATTCVSKKKK